METVIVEDLGIENGFKRKKISLMNPKKENVMANAQSYFSKDEKKEAKLKHKLNK